MRPSLLKKLISVFDKKQHKQLVGLGIMIFIGGVLETLGVSTMIPVVTAILNPEKIIDFINRHAVLKSVCNFFHIDLNYGFSVTLALIVILILIYVLKNAFLLLLIYRQNHFISHTRNVMISRVMRDFLNRPYEDYLGADIPTVFRITDSDIPQTLNLMLSFLNLSSEAVVSLLIFIVLLIQDVKLTLFIVVVFGILTLLIMKAIKPKLNKIGKRNLMVQSRISRWRLEAIYGLKDVKVLNRENFFIRNYYKSGVQGADISRNYAVINNIPRLLIETVFIAAMLSYVAFYISGSGEITDLLTTLTTFAVAAIRMLPSVNRMNSYMSEIAFYQPSLEYVYDHLQSGIRVDSNLAAEVPENRSKMKFDDRIEMKNISYHYPESKQQIFESANLTVLKGQSVGIMGPSGAGKSTVVDILLGLLRAQEGQILCDGVDIFSNYEGWLARIGYIPQSIYLVDETIRENIAFGIDDDKISEERIWEVLKEAQLDEFIRTLPEGLDTTIGDRGVRLSGGQRQRLGIARALYNNPEILVFDEATSALDNDTEQAVMDAVNSFHGKKTMVIIAHRLNTIEKCDVIYKVADGKIEETKL